MRSNKSGIKRSSSYNDLNPTPTPTPSVSTVRVKPKMIDASTSMQEDQAVAEIIDNYKKSLSGFRDIHKQSLLDEQADRASALVKKVLNAPELQTTEKIDLLSKNGISFIETFSRHPNQGIEILKEIINTSDDIKSIKALLVAPNGQFWRSLFQREKALEVIINSEKLSSADKKDLLLSADNSGKILLHKAVLANNRQILTVIINSEKLSSADKKDLLLAPEGKENALHYAAQRQLLLPIEQMIDSKTFSQEDKKDFLLSATEEGNKLMHYVIKTNMKKEDKVSKLLLNVLKIGDEDFIKNALLNKKDKNNIFSSIPVSLSEGYLKCAINIIENESLSPTSKKELLCSDGNKFVSAHNRTLIPLTEAIVKSPTLNTNEKLSLLEMENTPNSNLLINSIESGKLELTKQIFALPGINDEHRNKISELINSKSLPIHRYYLEKMGPSLITAIRLSNVPFQWEVKDDMLMQAAKEAIDQKDLKGLENIGTNYPGFMKKNRDIKLSKEGPTLLEYAKSQLTSPDDQPFVEAMKKLKFGDSRQPLVNQVTKHLGRKTNSFTKKIQSFVKAGPKEEKKKPLDLDSEEVIIKMTNNSLSRVSSAPPMSQEDQYRYQIKEKFDKKYHNIIDKIMNEESSGHEIDKTYPDKYRSPRTMINLLMLKPSLEKSKSLITKKLDRLIDIHNPQLSDPLIPTNELIKSIFEKNYHSIIDEIFTEDHRTYPYTHSPKEFSDEPNGEEYAKIKRELNGLSGWIIAYEKNDQFKKIITEKLDRLIDIVKSQPSAPTMSQEEQYRYDIKEKFNEKYHDIIDKIMNEESSEHKIDKTYPDKYGSLRNMINLLMSTPSLEIAKGLITKDLDNLLKVKGNSQGHTH